MLLLSILIFFIIFSVVILIHEWGHFASARRHGIHVEEFGLGMPPKAKTLWKDKKGCEYTFNWIPFGGFVRMEGEDAVDEGLKKTKGSFASKSILARMEVILAGVFMNFVLAMGILTILFTLGAKPILLDKEGVQEAIDNKIVVLDEGLPVLALEDGPAKEAGLQVGDAVLAINGTTIMSAEEIAALQTAGESSRYTVLREVDGTKIQTVLNIEANEEGKVLAAFSTFPKFKEVKEISFPVHQAFMYSLETSGKIAVATVKAFKGLIVRLVTQAQVPQGISGPVGIAAMTHGIVQEGDIEQVFKFVALLSLSLAIMNVLPIPALDGGRFMFLLVEAVMRRPIKAEWETRIHSVSYLLLIGLILIVTGNDIYKLIVSAFS